MYLFRFKGFLVLCEMRTVWRIARGEKRRHIFYVDFTINNIILLMPFSIENLAEIEAHLATHPTLNEGGAPGTADVAIFTALGSNTHLI